MTIIDKVMASNQCDVRQAIIDEYCPSEFGYKDVNTTRDEYECECNCVDCWNRELPTEESKEELKEEPKEANKTSEMITIILSRSQIESLKDFIDGDFIPSIHNDPYIDNIDYIADICEVYRILQKYV